MSTRASVRQARGGWWHEYVCPVHHCELGPAVTEDGGSEAYPCPHGCQLAGEPFASAWTVLHHQGGARLLRRRARQYARSGEPEHRDEALELLRGFADLYANLAPERHDGAQEWMLAGRLFHQALTEAIWTTSVADAVLELAASPHRLPAHDLAFAVPLLASLHDAALTARTALVERGDLRSNYTAWLDAAGALSAQALTALGAGPATVVDWIEGPAGVVEHAEAALLQDGWEWEASTYYHVFVLRAYLLALRRKRPDQLPPHLVERLRAMVGVVTDLAMPDGTLPALHDTPYGRGATWAEYAEAFTLAGQLLDASDLSRLVAQARARDGADDGIVDVLDGWFAGEPVAGPPGPGTGNVLHGNAGYAVLRSGDLNAVVAFGPHGGSHGHLDKLSLYLFGPSTPWQPDPGTTPYGSAMRHGYYARTAAHPTFSVGGADQAECTGMLLRWEESENGVTVVAGVDTAYPGVRAYRQLIATRGYLVDVVVVEGAADDVHLALRPDVDMRVEVHRSGLLLSTWEGDQVLRGWHLLLPGQHVLARPGPGPSDDPQRTRMHVDLVALTQRGSEVAFVTVWQALAGGAPESENIIDVRAGHQLVQVRLADGSTHIHPWGATTGADAVNAP